MNTVTHYVAVGCNKNFIRTTYESYEHNPPKKHPENTKKYMGTFVGLTKTRKNNKNSYEFESCQAYNKSLAKEEDESPLESTKEVGTFDEFDIGNSAEEYGVSEMNGREVGDHTTKERGDESNDQQKTECDELAVEKGDKSNENYNVEAVEDDDRLNNNVDHVNEVVDKIEEKRMHTPITPDAESNQEETENEIRNAERTSWSPGHKATRSPHGAGDLDTTIDERLNGIRRAETQEGNRGETRVGYRATGGQSEAGDEVGEDGKTKVEKTIDMLPAATVEEEL